MLKLALPTLAVLVVQTFVGIMETYFVSSLDADVLAGVSVFSGTTIYCAVWVMMSA